MKQKDIRTLLNKKTLFSEINVVKSISICLIIFVIFAVPKLWGEIKFIQLSTSGYNFVPLFSAIGSVLIPLISGILLWKSNPIGWIIGIAFFIYSFITDGAIFLFKVINFQYFNFENIVYDIPLLIIMTWALYWLLRTQIIKFLNVNRETVLILIILSLGYSIWATIKLYKFMTGMVYG